MTLSPPVSKVNAGPSGKYEQLLGDLRQLPLLPAVAQQALALVKDEKTSLQDLGNLIEQDVTLASTLLKLANSSFYSNGRTVESLQQALMRLGLRECGNLILAASMRNLFQKADAVTTGRCAVLWQHCF